MFMKEQLHLLKKGQKDKTGEEELSSENSELVKLLRQQNASLLEESVSKNEIIKIMLEISCMIGVLAHASILTM